MAKKAAATDPVDSKVADPEIEKSNEENGLPQMANRDASGNLSFEEVQAKMREAEYANNPTAKAHFDHSLAQIKKLEEDVKAEGAHARKVQAEAASKGAIQVLDAAAGTRHLRDTAEVTEDDSPLAVAAKDRKAAAETPPERPWDKQA